MEEALIDRIMNNIGKKHGGVTGASGQRKLRSKNTKRKEKSKNFGTDLSNNNAGQIRSPPEVPDFSFADFLRGTGLEEGAEKDESVAIKRFRKAFRVIMWLSSFTIGLTLIGALVVHNEGMNQVLNVLFPSWLAETIGSYHSQVQYNLKVISPVFPIVQQLPEEDEIGYFRILLHIMAYPYTSVYANFLCNMF